MAEEVVKPKLADVLFDLAGGFATIVTVGGVVEAQMLLELVADTHPQEFQAVTTQRIVSQLLAGATV